MVSFAVGSKTDHSDNNPEEKKTGIVTMEGRTRSQTEVGGGMEECLESGSSVGSSEEVLL